MRGDAVESVHYGSVAVVDRDGRLLFAAGDPACDDVHAQRAEAVAGAAVRARRRARALRIRRRAGRAALREPFGRAAARRRGRRHAGARRQRAGRSACGTHVPGFYDARGEVPPPPPYSPLAHNCSGKHAGMLACCVHARLAQARLSRVRPSAAAGDPRARWPRFAASAEDELRAGIDGCSAPNYAMPLARLALAFAQARDGRRGRSAVRPRARAPARRDGRASGNGLGRAAQRPRAVAGRARATGSRRSAPKACRRSACAAAGWGMAIKVADGSKRGLFPAVVAVLDQLGLLDTRPACRGWPRCGSPRSRNYRGIADRRASGRSLCWTGPGRPQKACHNSRIIPQLAMNFGDFLRSLPAVRRGPSEERTAGRRDGAAATVPSGCSQQTHTRDV